MSWRTIKSLLGLTRPQWLRNFFAIFQENRQAAAYCGSLEKFYPSWRVEFCGKFFTLSYFHQIESVEFIHNGAVDKVHMEMIFNRLLIDRLVESERDAYRGE